jgi:hypothetical protein
LEKEFMARPLIASSLTEAMFLKGAEQQPARHPLQESCSNDSQVANNQSC